MRLSFCELFTIYLLTYLLTYGRLRWGGV